VLLDQWLDLLRARLLEAARAPRGPEGVTGVPRLAHGIDLLLGKRAHLKSGADGTLLVQVAAIELARLPDARDLDAILASLVGGAAGRGAASRPRDARSPAAPSGDGAALAPAGPAAVPSAAVTPAGVTPAAVTLAAVTPAAVTPAAVLDLAALREAWSGLARRARDRDERLGEALARAEPCAFDGARVVVRLPADAGPLRSVLLRREMRLAFGQLAREQTGRFLEIDLEEEPVTAAVEAHVAPELRSHPAVQRVAERTAGRLIHVERVGRSGGADARAAECEAEDGEPGP
jgi:hypothetical protein